MHIVVVMNVWAVSIGEMSAAAVDLVWFMVLSNAIYGPIE